MTVDSSSIVPEANPPLTVEPVKDPLFVQPNALDEVKALEEQESFNTTMKISTLADLKEKAGKVYKEMMKTMARTIIADMRKSQARIKRINRELRR